MGILRRVQINLSDVAAFGPSFLWRHLPRITGAETVLISVSGQKIHVRAGDSDIDAVRQVYGERQYDVGFNEPVAKRIERRYFEILAAKKTPIIVDAGANIGAASLWFAGKYDRAIIVSVEPENGNFGVLVKNASLCDRIRPVHAAIGSTRGFVRVDAGQLGWSSRTTRADQGVPIITMEDAFIEGEPFIAKVDIEGFEADLFSDNTDWIAKTFVVFIEPHDWMMPERGTSRSFQAAMGREDFEIYLAGEMLTYIRR
jgi:FkbM family methyltransferase